MQDNATLLRMKKFNEQNIEAEKAYQNQLYKMNRDYDRSEVYANEDYLKTTSRSNRDFNLQQQYTEADFYRQRAIALRDFNITQQRSDEDYQISKQRSAQDHNFSLQQIMLSGDALSYYYSQRQYNLDTQRAEEDYQRQKSRNQQDFDRQQGDADQQFQISRSRQIQQFNISLADQAEDFKIQRKRALEEFDIQKSDAEYNYEDMQRQRNNAFAESFQSENMTQQQRLKLQATFNQSTIDADSQLMQQGLDWDYQIGQLLAQARSDVNHSSGAPGYAIGGYTLGGPAMLHGGEFVLTAETTRAAEKVAKGNHLTQDAFKNGVGGFQYTDNRSFSRGLAADEKTQLRQETQQMVMDAFNR
jgi:hypothetical protein